MEAEPNCSSHCESGWCFITPGVNNQQGWDVLQRLCALSAGGEEVKMLSLSTALRAVVWTLLSCGILLTLFFLLFTLRFKNNRIVKMSSPNLNILSLCGSVLTYSSGFLFAMEDKAPPQGPGSRLILQTRIWTLCIGSSLVFGPILGKTWRLYRVFTQRVPDKRVIIKDLHLMGLVTLLVLVDAVVLTSWSLVDPIKCSESVSAVVKVVEMDTSFTLSRSHSCTSLYSDLWVILLSVLKGSLLLYGTYLAGLTSNVSLPPVNQSLTIMGAVCLITMSTVVALPVSLYLYAWPNVVYSVVSGAIFISTLSINALLFIPQLTRWRQFEEETNSQHSQISKYFSSPCKSTQSMYSEDEIYYLLGENDSMKRIINEKNAIIDSLQEQVNNAKDKLLKLMTVNQPVDEGEMDSSNTNLNSTSTHTTAVSPDSPTPFVVEFSEVPLAKTLSPPPYVPPPPPPSHPTSLQASSENTLDVTCSLPSPLSSVNSETNQWSVKSNHDASPLLKSTRNSVSCSNGPDGQIEKPFGQDDAVSGFHDSTQIEVPSSEHPKEEQTLFPVGRLGFVSNKQLVEILQDLSVDAVSSSRKSPNMSPDDLSSPNSPRSPVDFFFPTISPYIMRKRRPPFYSSRGGPPPYYFPGSVPPGRSRALALPDEEWLRDQMHPDQRHMWRRRREEATALQLDPDGLLRSGCLQSPSHKCSPAPLPGQDHQCSPAGLTESGKEPEEPFDYSDSDSSSSEDCSYYRRRYCGTCRHSLDSTESLTSGSSDSDEEEFYRSGQPVVNFKVDLKPTFV